MSDPAYHEYTPVNVRLACGLHALNNMLGGPAFSVASLKAIAATLPEVSGGYSSSIPGVQNWDASVLVAALSQLNLAAEPLGKPEEAIPNLSLFKGTHQIVGFLVNIPSTGLTRFMRARHWICARVTSPQNITVHDSSNRSPQLFTSELRFAQWLSDTVEADGHVFVVRPIS